MNIPPLSALILAGGRARRMEGQDKGLLVLRGRPLVAWVIDCLTPQSAEILISANRNLEAYGSFGHPVLRDATEDFDGPLAGLLRGLECASHPLLLCVPCDTPFLPNDLAMRLHQALQESSADIAVAATRGHVHRTVCLCRRELAGALRRFLGEGCRQVGSWQATLKTTVVTFEDEGAFANLNTPQELAAAEQ